MSTGAVFKLLVNDGKADRMILATKLLYQRIQDIMYARSRQGRDDITPTLIDLERTHIVYVNAHFKPFAAIGYEYNKVRPSSGNSTLGASVQFSIPQFGDFFHDMVCRVQLSSVQGATGSTPAQTTTSGDQTASVFPCNLVQAVNGRPSYYYNLVDFNGNLLVAGGVTGATAAAGAATYRNLVRYCEFPGNRLFTSVSFDVNGNPLDYYDQYVPVMLEKFAVLPNKRDGYNKLVGQQVPIPGVSAPKQSVVYDPQNAKTQLPTYSAAGVGTGVYTAANVQSNATYPLAAQAITKFNNQESNQTCGLYHTISTNTVASRGIGETFGYNYVIPAATTATAIPTSLVALVVGTPTVTTQATSQLDAYANTTSTTDQQFDISSELKQYVNGPQVPKPVQPPLEIWNKLKFWFNDDVRLSIPSVSIPYGQRFITIGLNQASALVYETPGLYLETVCSTASSNALVNPAAFVSQVSTLLTAARAFNAANFTITGTGGGVAPALTAQTNYIAAIQTAATANTTFSGTPSVANLISLLAALSALATQASAFSDVFDGLTAGTNVTTFLVNVVQIVASQYGASGTITAAIQNIAVMTNMLVEANYTYAACSYYSYTPIYQQFGLNTTGTGGFNVTNIELYINNIFVNPEVHDIFIRRIGFALIRVYREQQTNLMSAQENDVLLSALKWPVEFMLVGVQPVWNQYEAQYSGGFISSGNANVWRDWHRMTYQVEATALQAQSKAANGFGGSTVGQVGTDKYYISVSTVDSLALVAHGISIYDNYSDAFFSNYLPYHYGEAKVVTPYDTGCFLVNMSLFPRSYQPSGHINISRARETYINIFSSYITKQTPALLIVIAICINFLLVSDGSAVLRYST